MENKNRPEKTFSTGAINVSVWKNEGTTKDGAKSEFRTVNIQRRYADKSGEWKSTSTFRVNDLPRLALAINKAFEHLTMNERESGRESGFVEEIVA
jgi:hypothetical protein